MMDDLTDAVEKVDNRKANGVALGDFASGYSSLDNLKRLPLDILITDKSFVQHLDFDSNDRAIVEVMLATARHRGLRVIVESVETET